MGQLWDILTITGFIAIIMSVIVKWIYNWRENKKEEASRQELKKAKEVISENRRTGQKPENLDWAKETIKQAGERKRQRKPETYVANSLNQHFIRLPVYIIGSWLVITIVMITVWLFGDITIGPVHVSEGITALFGLWLLYLGVCALGLLTVIFFLIFFRWVLDLALGEF